MTTSCVIIMIVMNMYNFIYNIHVALIMVIVEKMVATQVQI
jgi:hypothetical protein